MTALDPVVRAELDALEAALDGAPGADPELMTLVEDVRATAAPMPPALRATLEDRAAAGFPHAARRTPWPTGLRRPRVGLLPALGALAAVLLALVVATAALRDGGGGTDHPTAATPKTAAPSVATAPAAGAGAGAAAESAPAAPVPSPAPSPSSSDTARGFARKVQRAVELGLRVPGARLQDTVDGVVRVTQSSGGYVSLSTVAARSGGGTADLTLRIPTARLDGAVAALSRLGHVSSLDQSAQDITGSFVSVASDLKDARAERRALLRALGRATTSQQIAALRARLRANRSEIAQLKGRMAALRRRADLSTVQVSVVARGAAAAVPGDRGWSPRDAAHDALRVLEVAAGVLLVGLAVLVPFAVLAALLWPAGRALRRRRREHALDAA